MSDTQKVLVVEDHEMNMELICDLLNADGFEPVKAHDASEAFGILSREHPALILMDIALPGIDGIEATRRIKADETTRHIPVIAVTASSMRLDRQELLDAGCEDVVYKPIDFPRMRAAIRAALGESHA